MNNRYHWKWFVQLWQWLDICSSHWTQFPVMTPSEISLGRESDRCARAAESHYANSAAFNRTLAYWKICPARVQVRSARLETQRTLRPPVLTYSICPLCCKSKAEDAQFSGSPEASIALSHRTDLPLRYCMITRCWICAMTLCSSSAVVWPLRPPFLSHSI